MVRERRAARSAPGFLSGPGRPESTAAAAAAHHASTLNHKINVSMEKKGEGRDVLVPSPPGRRRLETLPGLSDQNHRAPPEGTHTHTKNMI